MKISHLYCGLGLMTLISFSAFAQLGEVKPAEQKPLTPQNVVPLKDRKCSDFVFAQEDLRACGLDGMMGTYIDRCIKGGGSNSLSWQQKVGLMEKTGDLHSANSPESQILRREQIKQFFDKEIQYLTRIPRDTPGYDDLWRRFESRWRGILEKNKMTKGQMTALGLDPQDFQSIETRLNSLNCEDIKSPCVKDTISLGHQVAELASPGTMRYGNQLLRNAALLYLLDTDRMKEYTRRELNQSRGTIEKNYRARIESNTTKQINAVLVSDLSEEDKNAKMAEIRKSKDEQLAKVAARVTKELTDNLEKTIQGRKDIIYSEHPELKDEAVFGKAVAILDKHLKISNDDSPFMNAMLNQTSYAGILENIGGNITGINGGGNGRVNIVGTADFTALELAGTNKIKTIQDDLQRQIAETTSNPATLYDYNGLVMGAIANLKSRSPQKAYFLGLYCSKAADDKSWEETKATVQIGAGVTLLVGGVVASAFTAGAASPAAIAGAQIVAAAGATYMVASNAHNISEGYRQAEIAKRKFYAGQVNASDLDAARKQIEFELSLDPSKIKVGSAYKWAAVDAATTIMGVGAASKMLQSVKIAGKTFQVAKGIRGAELVTTGAIGANQLAEGNTTGFIMAGAGFAVGAAGARGYGKKPATGAGVETGPNVEVPNAQTKSPTAAGHSEVITPKTGADVKVLPKTEVVGMMRETFDTPARVKAVKNGEGQMIIADPQDPTGRLIYDPKTRMLVSEVTPPGKGQKRTVQRYQLDQDGAVAFEKEFINPKTESPGPKAETQEPKSFVVAFDVKRGTSKSGSYPIGATGSFNQVADLITQNLGKNLTAKETTPGLFEIRSAEAPNKWVVFDSRGDKPFVSVKTKNSSETVNLNTQAGAHKEMIAAIKKAQGTEPPNVSEKAAVSPTEDATASAGRTRKIYGRGGSKDPQAQPKTEEFQLDAKAAKTLEGEISSQNPAIKFGNTPEIAANAAPTELRSAQTQPLTKLSVDNASNVIGDIWGNRKIETATMNPDGTLVLTGVNRNRRMIYNPQDKVLVTETPQRGTFDEGGNWKKTPPKVERFQLDAEAARAFEAKISQEHPAAMKLPQDSNRLTANANLEDAFPKTKSFGKMEDKALASIRETVGDDPKFVKTGKGTGADDQAFKLVNPKNRRQTAEIDLSNNRIKSKNYDGEIPPAIREQLQEFYNAKTDNTIPAAPKGTSAAQILEQHVGSKPNVAYYPEQNTLVLTGKSGGRLKRLFTKEHTVKVNLEDGTYTIYGKNEKVIQQAKPLTPEMKADFASVVKAYEALPKFSPTIVKSALPKALSRWVGKNPEATYVESAGRIYLKGKSPFLRKPYTAMVDLVEGTFQIIDKNGNPRGGARELPQDFIKATEEIKTAAKRMQKKNSDLAEATSDLTPSYTRKPSGDEIPELNPIEREGMVAMKQAAEEATTVNVRDKKGDIFSMKKPNGDVVEVNLKEGNIEVTTSGQKKKYSLTERVKNALKKALCACSEGKCSIP